MSAGANNSEGVISVLRRGHLRVVALAVVLLLIGWLVRGQHVDRTSVYRGFQGLSLEYPEGWMVTSPAQAGAAPREPTVITDVLYTGPFKPRLEVRRAALPVEVKPRDVLAYLKLNLQHRLILLHTIHQQSLRRGPFDGYRLDYAHALNPVASADDPTTTDVPVAVRVSTLAVLRGRELLSVSVSQPVEHQAANPRLAGQILDSLEVKR